MEARALVAEALLASAESAEVLGRLWHILVVEVEVDDAGLAAVVDLEVDWSRHCGWWRECEIKECLCNDDGRYVVVSIGR